MEFVVDADEENSQDHNGQQIRHIPAHPIAHLQALAGVGLLGKVLPAPAVAGRAEQQVDQRADRQPNIGHQEIFQIHNGGAVAEGLEAGPQIETQHAGQRQHQHQRQVDDGDLFAAHARQVHPAGHDVFKHRQDGGHGGKEQKHEEQAAPQLPHGHVVKDVGQAEGVDGKAQNDHQHHPAAHHQGLAQHLAVNGADAGGILSHESAGDHEIEIVQHPAGDRCVEHHQKIVADQAEVAVEMPFLARLFQHAIGQHRAFPAGAAHGKLHGHDRQPQKQQKQDIKQHEGRAAVLSRKIRELPHVSDADGTARREQDKAQAGASFSLSIV